MKNLPVGEVEVLMHMHPERGCLQAVQVDDAVLGASDFDIVDCEEPVAVGVCQYQVKSVTRQSGGI